MSIVLDGEKIETPGLETFCFLDTEHKVPRATDGKPRRQPPSCIVIHTVSGKTGDLIKEAPSSERAEAFARYQASTPRDVSWHFTVDVDGTIIQSCDAYAWWCWHAGHVNPWSIGIELVQESNGDLYAPQMATLEKLVTLLCDRIRIPKSVPVDAAGSPMLHVVKSWRSFAAGGQEERFAGVLGHCNVTLAKPVGDPGVFPFVELLKAGYQGVVIPESAIIRH